MGDWTDFLIAVPTVVNMAFAFAFGASAGSFMHVLVHRMPQGLSVISPPSRCPTCGHRLRWSENIPIVSWIRLRGRCSACGVPIPSRYLWSEVGMGALFLLAYAVLFLPRPGSFWFPVGEGWWRSHGLLAASPALLAVWAGIGALVAMTVVDARSFLIPVAIPGWCSVLAFMLWTVAGAVAGPVDGTFPLPLPPWPACMAAMGGLAGLAVGWALLQRGVIPRSFEDYGDYAADESDVFADYPHARREMVKELAFVGPAVLLAAVGWLIAPHLPPPQAMPGWLDGFLSVASGFLLGGAVVWALRIVATLLLDTEALGLGDVHLMACVGAVFGWKVAIGGFLAAPFLGLAWWLLNAFRQAPTRMPYGPALAIGSLAAWGLEPVVSGVVGASLSSMSSLSTFARRSPAEMLAVTGVLGAAMLALAVAARRRGGLPASGSILFGVAATVAWILAAPVRPGAGIAVGALLASACVVGSVLAGSRLEDSPGPRTALSRILRLLAVMIVAVGLAFAVLRPEAGAPVGQIDGAGPLHGDDSRVE